MCKLSAVLMSMGSSFHHFGARIANRRVFADGNLGPPRSAGAASRLADAERSAGVCGSTNIVHYSLWMIPFVCSAKLDWMVVMLLQLHFFLNGNGEKESTDVEPVLEIISIWPQAWCLTVAAVVKVKVRSIFI